MTLVDIAKLPTAENSAIHLHPSDNVAIARVPLATGLTIKIDGNAITLQEPVAAGHKVAIRTIPAGEHVIRYGQVIGRAKHTIEPGRHLHVHNVAFEELSFNYEFPTGELAIADPKPAPTRRPCGNAQLHRRGCGLQLRRAYRRIDRPEL